MLALNLGPDLSPKSCAYFATVTDYVGHEFRHNRRQCPVRIGERGEIVSALDLLYLIAFGTPPIFAGLSLVGLVPESSHSTAKVANDSFFFGLVC